MNKPKNSGPGSILAYGYLKDDGDAEIKELEQVSLCFRSSEDMRAFGEFVIAVASASSVDPLWDHEHYLDQFDNEDENTADVILAYQQIEDE